jgi:hypothetical protein
LFLKAEYIVVHILEAHCCSIGERLTLKGPKSGNYLRFVAHLQDETIEVWKAVCEGRESMRGLERKGGEMEGEE